MSTPTPVEDKTIVASATTGLEADTEALKLSGSPTVAGTMTTDVSTDVKPAAAFAIVDGESSEMKTEGENVPVHRSHNPNNNLKRSDPFQFGSRYLNEGDDVFEFNAWDHVETDETYRQFAEEQIARQRQSPVSDFDKSRFNSDPAKWWNLFYKNNTTNFFKDRKWLRQEFPILSESIQATAGPKTVLEIGAGAGNTVFPLLAANENPKLRIHACDFSKKAVEVMRSQDTYDTAFMQADVWDVAGDIFPPDLEDNSVDVAILIFIFSALSPMQWMKAVENVSRLVKPGGHVCFRDYGRGDLAQVRFRKGRYMEENFYVRGDGTRVYFFDEKELQSIWGETFTIDNLGVDNRLIVNRGTKQKMYRSWIQGRFTRNEK